MKTIKVLLAASFLALSALAISPSLHSGVSPAFADPPDPVSCTPPC